MTWGVLLAGFGLGVGLLMVGRALLPSPPRLDRALQRLETPGVSVLDTTSGGGRSVQTSISVAALRRLSAVGLVDEEGLRVRLLILDRSPSQHAFAKLLGGVVGFGVPVLLTAGLVAVGARIPIGLVLGLAAVFGALGFVLPDIGLEGRIEEKRQAFRHALSAYLDLVTVILAGGGGIETALHSAAEKGDGWAFERLRAALARAQGARITPWEAFARLGHDLGVHELEELAAAAHLAGHEGARIRQSLSRKADTMRALQTATAEAEAEAATTRMVIPGVLMLVALLLFIGYGAVGALLAPAVLP